MVDFNRKLAEYEALSRGEPVLGAGAQDSRGGPDVYEGTDQPRKENPTGIDLEAPQAVQEQQEPPCQLPSVARITCAQAVEGLLSLVNADSPILDCTYGSGDFWRGSSRSVFGTDLETSRAKDQVADFRSLPFTDGQFPTVVFDPPFHPYVGSREEEQFRGMGKNDKELRQNFDAGLRECWRVTSRHLLVKCQGYIHNHKPQWMPLWCIAICGEPFEWLVVYRDHKVVSSKWVHTYSLRRNHADYLLFDKRGNHR